LTPKKNFVYVCRRCKKVHSPEEFNESRYCRDCGTFLSQSNKKSVDYLSITCTDEYLKKEDILNLVRKHDEENIWWIEQEKIVGDELKTTMKLSKDNLLRIIEWKFESNALVKKVQLNRAKKLDGNQLENVSNQVFNLDTNHDREKILLLCKFNGIGPAVASVILTFFDPENYCVVDFHVYEEVFGVRPEPLTPEKYVRLLRRFREEAKTHHLRVRDIEKAYFLKNCEKSSCD